MEQNVIFGTEGRRKIVIGVDLIANAVKVTLGSNGRNVIIDNEMAEPSITKDGVTVARAIMVKDPIESMGANLIKRVATNVVDIAGDGTTTSCVLAQVIIKHGLKAIDNGCNPMDVKAGIEIGVREVVYYIKSVATKVDKSGVMIKNIATISANNDKEIGELISAAISKVGSEGSISVESSRNYESSIEVVEGMKLDRGYFDPGMLKDKSKTKIELENPLILLYDKKINSLNQIIKLLEVVAQAKRHILFIAEDYDYDFIATIVANNHKGVITSCVIKAPSFGEEKNNILQDIATVTNAQLVSSETGEGVEDITFDMLGSCEKAIITRDSCILFRGIGKQLEINARCKELKLVIKETESEVDKFNIQKRISRMLGTIAVIKVGGVTDIEINEKKDRIDDALRATRCAIEEGIVAGGGTTLIHAIDKIKGTYKNQDIKIGVDIIRKSISEPFKQILLNGGIDSTEYISKIKNEKYGYGLNLKTNEFTDLIKIGVIDPAKVTRVALENAASIASIFLTTECVISNK